MARAETVTVVFTDMVGSTELAGRLGPAGLLASCTALGGGGAPLRGRLAMNEGLKVRPHVVGSRRGYAQMLLDRNASGDREGARELIAAAEAETLGVARELVRFEPPSAGFFS